jgi:hypothetical protein
LGGLVRCGLVQKKHCENDLARPEFCNSRVQYA